MATAVFEDLVVPEGEVRTYTQNSDSGHVGALMFAPPDTSGVPQPSLTNYGEMRLQADGSGAQWFIRFATYSFWDSAQISNYGIISAVVPGSSLVTALHAQSWSPDLLNAGTIVAEAGIGAVGYESWDHSLTIDNLATGSISARAGDSAIALFLANGATITNAGEIAATALGGSAYAISLPNGNGTVVNSGLIQATDNNPASPYAVGIVFYVNTTIVNSGTIRGDYAIRENNPYEYEGWGAQVRNTGLIEGLISLVHGNDSVINAGQIVGDVDLGADYDIYDGRLGTIQGTVLGGEGNDLLLGGLGRDALKGGGDADALFARGGDTLTGGAGGDIFVYTAVTAGAPAETITDFVSGTDRIDLRNLAPTSVTIHGSTVSAVTAAGTLTIQVNGAVTLADILAAPTPTVTGTAGNDTLVAGPEGAVLSGGDGRDLLVGGTGNDRLDGGPGWRDSDYDDHGDQMWGGAGDDTYVVDDQVRDYVVEDLDAGYDTVELTNGQGIGLWPYALPDNVERVIGGGADGNALDNVMVGSSAGERFHGRDGNDSIDGGAGHDSLSGDAGDDILVGGAGGDSMTGGAGADVFLYGAPSDSTAQEMDWLSDFVHGTDLVDVRAISVTGFTFEPFDTGTAWTKVTIATTGVSLVLNIAGAADLADFRYVFSAPGQNLVGTSGDDTLQGGLGPDTLNGGSGNDTLIGGAGTDTMIGGLGNDWFYVDAAGDAVNEAAGQGTDRVFSSSSYILAAGVSIETLSTDNNTGTAALTLTGNELANGVYGNNGNNSVYGGGGNDTLIGLNGDDVLIGGAGTDSMSGGLGNDWFYVNSSTDAVNETAGEGDDRIFTSSNYVLAAGVSIETLSTDNTAATTAITLIGNELANNVYGNHGNNSLYGSNGNDTLIGLDGDDALNGGLGTDSMWGGIGNDWFYVNTSTDGVNETAGEGDDRIFTSSSYVLAAGVSVETLSTDSAAATTAITLIGNELANNIYGNYGDNSLYGSRGNDTLIAHDGADMLNGGEGADSLTGGAGADTFVFADVAGAGNIDSIGDYVVADDVIHIDNAVFAGISPGALDANAFVVGAAAVDADDRIVYNSATGVLLFDADGNGAGAAVQFATLAAGLAMTAGEFLVI